MVVLLILVKPLEIVHARHDLLRNGELERFVSRPVACGQYLDVKLDWILLKLAFLDALLPMIPVIFGLVLRQFEIVHHALDAVGDLATAVYLELGDNTPLVFDAFRLFAEEPAGQVVLEGLDEDVLVSTWILYLPQSK